MFIQFITARAKDEAAIRQAIQRWPEQVGPHAVGFLGTTSGFTKEGEVVVVARFESEADARKNSDLPQQTEWWNSLQAHIENPQFLDCPDAETFGQGGSDSAGFVQIITGRSTEKDRLRKIADEEMDSAMRETRPDVIGGTSAWSGDRFVETIYFTSEAEARENEAKPIEGRVKELMDEYNSLTEDLRYYDLTDPILVSP